MKNLTVADLTRDDVFEEITRLYFSDRIEKIVNEMVYERESKLHIGGSYYCDLPDEAKQRGLDPHSCMVSYEVLSVSLEFL